MTSKKFSKYIKKISSRENYIKRKRETGDKKCTEQDLYWRQTYSKLRILINRVKASEQQDGLLEIKLVQKLIKHLNNLLTEN